MRMRYHSFKTVLLSRPTSPELSITLFDPSKQQHQAPEDEHGFEYKMDYDNSHNDILCLLEYQEAPRRNLLHYIIYWILIDTGI